MTSEKDPANLEVFARTLVELADGLPDLTVAVSDSRGSARLGDFCRRYPDRVVEAGIAEQNLVGMAAGLSLGGKRVFAVSPAAFLTARSLEQIKNDVCYSRRPVILVGISAGVSYGALGLTHHSLHDLAVLRTFPHLIVTCPADRWETEEAVKAAARSDRPVYLRFGKKPMPALPVGEGEVFSFNRARRIRTGRDGLILAAGEVVAPALVAAENLVSRGYDMGVMSVHTLSPLDGDFIREQAAEVGAVLTVEEHSLSGGLGEACAGTLLAGRYTGAFRSLGLPKEGMIHASQEDLFKAYRLDGEGIAETMEDMLNGKG